MIDLNNKILIWDNDGTVTGAKNPNDKSSSAKIILPNIKETMEHSKFNFIISGFKSLESEKQNFDPELITKKFIALMKQLPINAAIFSPAIGGISCYAVVQKTEQFSIIKAHENPRYKAYIGKFKKPDIGMFVVMKDIAFEWFNVTIETNNSLMIDDTWHDQAAAKSFGIDFIDAKEIHDQRR